MNEELDVLLEMRGISKSFPGVQALSDVDFAVCGGEVHALVGENGAGKSTLMKILAGAYSLDRGEIILRGAGQRILSPKHAQDLGIRIIYQELMHVPQMSVAENIFLGVQHKGRFGAIDWKTLYREAQSILDSLGIDVNPRDLVGNLSVAQQQMVEIAKALSAKADIIIMDEPTSSLTEHETTILFGVIRKLRSQGMGIVYISHRLEEIYEIADRVTVLRDGAVVGTLAVEEADRARLVAMMVGRKVTDFYHKEQVAIGDPILEVKRLTVDNVLENVSFTLHKGEILAFAGLVGAGRSEVMRAIFGVDRRSSGDIFLEGKPVQMRSPREAVRLGIGLVPENRKLQGLILSMVVRENISLSALYRLTHLGFIRRREERDLTEEYVRRLSIRTPSLEQTTVNLSGGNQQKVVIAKWLSLRPKVLILDEPTRGIDVGAKSEIHALMSQLAKQGVGILMISSELPEVLAMSDRIIVMHEGRVTGEFTKRDATQEEIMFCATGSVRCPAENRAS